MPQEYSKEQLWKLYEKLPEALKDAIFSVETADHIYDTCARNGIEDERISEVAKRTGRVLMGLIPPDNFQGVLEKELKLKKDAADKIAREINRFIFFPVKEELLGLYAMEASPTSGPAPAKTQKTAAAAGRAVESESEPIEIEEEISSLSEIKPKVKRDPDIYKEAIE